MYRCKKCDTEIPEEIYKKHLKRCVACYKRLLKRMSYGFFITGSGWLLLTCITFSATTSAGRWIQNLILGMFWIVFGMVFLKQVNRTYPENERIPP